jgi:hypothetical protein
MKFVLCTVAYPHCYSGKSSQVLGRTALPTFPCEHQQSAIPYVALVVFSCCHVFSLCVRLEEWQCRWILAGRTKPVSALGEPLGYEGDV